MDNGTGAATTAKSIIDPKYRNKYKNRAEWLSDLLKEHASLTKEHPAVAAVGEEGKEGYKPAKDARTTVEGVDTTALFAIGAENGFNLDKYKNQTDGHGFPGRFRMTVGNMLRAEAKKRHGIMLGGTFVEAPADWLEANKAPAEPTHAQDGTKIAKAKPAIAEPDSKLVKAIAGASAKEPVKAATSAKTVKKGK